MYRRQKNPSIRNAKYSSHEMDHIHFLLVITYTFKYILEIFCEILKSILGILNIDAERHF